MLLKSGCSLEEGILSGSGKGFVNITARSSAIDGQTANLKGTYQKILSDDSNIKINLNGNAETVEIGKKSTGSFTLSGGEAKAISMKASKGNIDILAGTVNSLNVEKGAKSNKITINGTSVAIKEVSLKEVATVDFIKGTAEKLTIEETAGNSQMTMASGSYLKNLIVNSPATIGGTGKIVNAYVYSNNVKLSIWPSGIYVSNGTVTDPGTNPELPRLPIANPNPTVSVKEGGTADINVGVPMGTILFYLSSDNSIATVSDKGIITGVSAGKTKIYVTAQHPGYSSNFAEVEVTVTSGNVTAPGTLSVEPAAWETGEQKNIILTYRAGDNMSDGTVVIKLPTGFSAYENDTVMINGGAERVLDRSQRPNSQTLSFTNLNLKANEGTIVVTLKNKLIPAGGEYVFTSISDSDGQGPRLPTADGAERAVFTANKLKVLVEGENANYTRPETGAAAGTAKLRRLSFIGLTGATQWIVKIQDGVFAAPVFDEVISGTAYRQGDNITAAAGQYMLLAAVDDGNRVKGYAIIQITSEMIRKNDADKLVPATHYHDPEPGVKANTARIRGLNLAGLDTAAERWMIQVQNTEVSYIFADEVFEGAQPYQEGDDIVAYEGQYILLAAVDSGNRIKAYADIRVTGNMLSKAAGDLKLENNFSSPEYGSAEGTTMIKTLAKGGYDIDKWMIVVLDKNSAIPGLNISASEFERYTGDKKLNEYIAGGNISAQEGQRLLLLGVKALGQDGKTNLIKAYVYLPVDANAVRKQNAPEIPDENFDAPVKGTEQYTTRILRLSLTVPAKINGAEKFMIKVQNGELAAPQLDSRLSGAADYTAGQNIPISAGQTLVLLATDHSGRIKAYKNIPVTDEQIRPADAMKLISPNDYQMDKGTKENATCIILPASDPAGVKEWRYKIQSTAFETPYKGSKIEDTTVYIKGTDIPNVSVDQRLLLLGVDSEGRTVAYAIEVLDYREIRQPQAKELKSKESGETDYNYSMPEPGQTGGTTRITELRRMGIQGATKWMYKVEDAAIASPDYDSTMTGIYVYNGESISVNEGQYFILFAVDDAGRIKAYANLQITAAQIRMLDAKRLETPYDYGNLKPGTGEGTTVISSLSFKNIEGYNESTWKWRYAVGNTQFPAPLKDSKVSTIPGLKPEFLTNTTNIPIQAGQYILLLAVDGNSEDSLIKGYANIYVSEREIMPGAAAVIPEANYSLAKGVAAGSTRFAKLDFIGLPNDATTWMILTQKGNFQTPIGRNTTVAGAKVYSHSTLPDIPVEIGSKILLLATDASYRVKAYAVIEEIREDQIQAPVAMKLEYIKDYTGPFEGAGEGTTKLTLLDQNIPKKDGETVVWKYKIGTQEFVLPHMGDDATAYRSTASGADIVAEPNDVLLVVATIDNKVKAYLQLRVSGDQIKPREAARLQQGTHYAAFVKGSRPGTSKIEGLDPRGIVGFAGWAVRVVATPQKLAADSYFGSPMLNIGDIEVKKGQHIVLAAVDAEGRVKAYADIEATEEMINPPTADKLISEKHYTSPRYGKTKGTTSVYVSLEGISGAKEFAIKVVDSEADLLAGQTIAYGGAAGADHNNFTAYMSGDDIAVRAGQYILLAAVGEAVDGVRPVLAYANIGVEETAVRPGDAYAMKSPDNYSALEPGSDVGTTRFTTLNFVGMAGSDLKWVIKVQDNPIEEAPMLDSSAEGMVVYSVNSNIQVKEGQYVFLYAVDALGKIKGYANNIKVTSDSVRGIAPLLKQGTSPDGNYTKPEPGSEINTVKIEGLNLPAEAKQWKYMVSNTAPGVILKDSQPAGYSNYFTRADIAAVEGQHLILLATDSAGLVKAYADIILTADMVRNIEALLSGTMISTPTGESHIAAGGRTIRIQLSYGEWKDDVLTDATKRNALYEGLTAVTEQTQWRKVTDALKKEGASAAELSSDKKTLTLTLSEAPTYDIAENQEIMLVIKPELMKGSTKAVTAQNSITIAANVNVQLEGTAITQGLSEGDIRAGGKTLILKISGKFALDVAADEEKRNAIFDGLKAAEPNSPDGEKWAVVVAALKQAGEKAINRSSGDRVTIQFPTAGPDYDIHLNSAIKVTVPHKTVGGKEILVGAIRDAEVTEALIVTADSSATLSGTLLAQKPVPESAIAAGGETLIITLTDGQWVTDISSNKARRDALFNGFTGSETAVRNALVNALISAGEYAIKRTSDSTVTITLPPVSYDIKNNQTITLLIPAACMVGAKAPLNAEGTIEIEREASAALTGTVGGAKEADIRTGGKTLVITLKDNTFWANDVETASVREELLNGLKADSEPEEWQKVIDRLKLGEGSITKTSTVLTIMLPPVPGYDIRMAKQTIKLTIPKSAVVGTSFDIKATGELAISSTPPVAAKVVQVSGQPDTTFKQGEIIEISVVFQEAVDVIGNPTLELKFDTGANRNAVYSSGTGTNTLKFNYTVQAGDLVQKLNYAGTNSLKVDGNSAIRNAGTETAAVLTLPALTAATALNASNISVDAAAPVFAATYPKDASKTDTTADILVKLNEKASVYYVVLEDTSSAPEVEQVIAGKDSSNTEVADLMKGMLSIEANTEGTIQLRGLTEYTKYKVYIAAVDMFGNKSTAVTAFAIETRDVTPPAFDLGYPVQQDEFDNKVVLKVRANEAGKIYLAAVPKGAAGLTSAQVKAARTGADGVVIVLSADIEKDAEKQLTLSPLSVSSVYDIYIALEDASGNLSPSPEVISGRTSQLNLENVSADLEKSILINTTAQMQYSFNGFDWNACSETNTAITYNENAEVFIVYIRETINPGNSREVLLPREESAVIALDLISYDIAAATVKNDSTRNLQFKISGGVWKALNAKATVKNVVFEPGAMMVRTAVSPAPNSKLPSTGVALDYVPEPMPAPTLGFDDENNAIKGLEAKHEYSLNNGTTWISGLVKGDFSGTKTVLVREKATKDQLPSYHQTLNFTAGKVEAAAFPGAKNTPAGKNFITITFEENTNRKDLSIQNFKDYFKVGTGDWNEVNNKFATEHVWGNIAKPVWTSANVLKVEFNNMDATTVKIDDEIKVLAGAGITNTAGTSGNYTSAGKLTGSFHTKPKIVSIKAVNTNKDIGFTDGEQVVITFDQPTNEPFIDGANIADYLTLKDSDGKDAKWDTGNGNLEVEWTADDTLVITFLKAEKTEVAVGCKVIVKTTWGLKDKDKTTEASDTSAVIGGSFTNPLKIEAAVIINKAGGVAQKMEVGDMIKITFDQVTNRETIKSSVLVNCFKLIGQDGKAHSWGVQSDSNILWSTDGKTLTITLSSITNVTLKSGDTLTITAGAGIKVKGNGSDAYEGSVVIKGNY